jgi:hypothetical protein
MRVISSAILALVSSGIESCVIAVYSGIHLVSMMKIGCLRLPIKGHQLLRGGMQFITGETGASFAPATSDPSAF